MSLRPNPQPNPHKGSRDGLFVEIEMFPDGAEMQWEAAGVHSSGRFAATMHHAHALITRKRDAWIDAGMIRASNWSCGDGPSARDQLREIKARPHAGAESLRFPLPLPPS